jgi:hypothetical protein
MPLDLDAIGVMAAAPEVAYSPPPEPMHVHIEEYQRLQRCREAVPLLVAELRSLRDVSVQIRAGNALAEALVEYLRHAPSPSQWAPSPEGQLLKRVQDVIAMLGR